MAPLQDQVIPIHFGQGLSSKTDEKLVVAGKMLRLENALFTKQGAINKRDGYLDFPTGRVGGGSLVAPDLVKSYQDELVVADQGKLYSFSEQEAAWVPKGEYHPSRITNGDISSTSVYRNLFVHGAILGNIAVYAWSEDGIPTATIVDLTTNVQLLTDFPLTSARPAGTFSHSFPKVCVFGGTKIGVFYLNPAVALSVRFANVTPTSVTFDPEIIIEPNPARTFAKQFNVGGASQAPAYFPCETPTGAAVLYATGATPFGVATALKLSTLSLAGAVTNTVTVVAAATDTVSLNRDTTTGNLWVYYCSPPGPGVVNFSYAIYSSALVGVLANTLYFTSPTTGLPQGVTAVSMSSTVQRVVLCFDSNITNGGPTIYTADIQSNGTIASPVAILLTNLYLAAELFLADGRQQFVCNNLSTVQPTAFIYDLTNRVTVAKAYLGKASDYRTSSFLGASLALSGNRERIVLGSTEEIAVGAGNPQAIFGATYFDIDYDDPELFQALEVKTNETLLLNGGKVFMYDGGPVVELGFDLFPEILTISASGTGGLMLAGTYQYYAVYRWGDLKGNIYESAPSPARSVTLGGGVTTGSVALAIKTLSPTQKQPLFGREHLEIRIYRTTANGNPQLAYDVNPYQTNNNLLPITNNPLAVAVTFTDTHSDASISSNEIIYTSGGVVENIAPPPTVTMILHINRVWLINSENPNQLWYSKSLTPGAGINFTDLFTMQVDAKGGECVALASMDDKLVILEEDLPLVVGGDGANDTGFGSTLTPPQPIPTDTGCLTSRGVAVFPMGVLFKAPKGIYLLDRSLNVKYWGTDVEAYNAQSIVQSTMDYDRNQIRFLTDAGLCLVYDYIFNQWATFTNHQGVSADIWRGRYVYARTDGALFKEEPGHYLDDSAAFKVLAQTAWLAMASVQGFQRVRRFNTLGTFENGADASHAIQISAAYDFEPLFSTPIAYVYGGVGESDVFQYRERLPRQKCDTISLLIEEVTSGDPDEFLALTDMSFEAGIKRGINKVAQTGMVS